MLPLMTLRVNHTIMATMFLVRALAKLSLAVPTASPCSNKLPLVTLSRSGGDQVVVALSNIWKVLERSMVLSG